MLSFRRFERRTVALLSPVSLVFNSKLRTQDSELPPQHRTVSHPNSSLLIPHSNFLIHYNLLAFQLSTQNQELNTSLTPLPRIPLYPPLSRPSRQSGTSNLIQCRIGFDSHESVPSSYRSLRAGTIFWKTADESRKQALFRRGTRLAGYSFMENDSGMLSRGVRSSPPAGFFLFDLLPGLQVRLR